MVGHLLELIRILEAVRAAVGRIETREIEMTASLTRSLPIALDLAALALVAAEIEDRGQSSHGKEKEVVSRSAEGPMKSLKTKKWKEKEVAIPCYRNVLRVSFEVS